MIKLLSGTLIGVFIGAFALEILNQRHPEKVKKIEAAAKRFSKEIVNSFVEVDEDDDFFNKEEVERGGL